MNKNDIIILDISYYNLLASILGKSLDYFLKLLLMFVKF